MGQWFNPKDDWEQNPTNLQLRWIERVDPSSKPPRLLPQSCVQSRESRRASNPPPLDPLDPPRLHPAAARSAASDAPSSPSLHGSTVSNASVKPASATPDETLPLAWVDRYPTHRGLVESMHILRSGADAVSGVIRDALAKALVFFYPLAGRIVEPETGGPAIRCTADGVYPTSTHRRSHAALKIQSRARVVNPSFISRAPLRLLRSHFGIGKRRGRERQASRRPRPQLPSLRPRVPPTTPRRRTMSSSAAAATASPPSTAADEGRPREVAEVDGRVASHVDPFLVEALDNPRHRLVVLRMELDIQKFMQNPQLHEFEFQHFPTSYLRCAAHRVAQHYGLETTVADNLVDGLVSRIVARKTPESKYPVIALSEVPGKQARNDHEAAEKLKFVICQRPKASQNDAAGAGAKNGAVKTVEERIEEYNIARARIFNGSIPADIEGISDLGALSVGIDEPVNVEPSVDENKISTMNSRSRVAVFKDTEKDRSDPDYDRNYKRYVRGPVPDFSVNPGAFNFVVPQFMQYGVGYVQSASMSRNQPSVYFGQPDLSMGSSSGTAVYPQWPTPAMMYPHCYDNLGHMISQVPVYQSFNHG